MFVPRFVNLFTKNVIVGVETRLCRSVWKPKVCWPKVIWYFNFLINICRYQCFQALSRGRWKSGYYLRILEEFLNVGHLTSGIQILISWQFWGRVFDLLWQGNWTLCLVWTRICLTCFQKLSLWQKENFRMSNRVRRAMANMRCN